jgi:hypothetical protein
MLVVAANARTEAPEPDTVWYARRALSYIKDDTGPSGRPAWAEKLITPVCSRSQPARELKHILTGWLSISLPEMEGRMLAEIFMLRLEALARGPQKTTSKSTSKFVPLSPAAPDEVEESVLDLAAEMPETIPHQV